jgi:hypothetical protein
MRNGGKGRKWEEKERRKEKEVRKRKKDSF